MRKILVGVLAATMITAHAHSQVSGQGGPIRVKADTSEVLDKERKVILSSNVDITQGDARLRADKVVLAYAGTGAAGSGMTGFGDIDTMTATGDVFYVTTDLKATGDVGVYDAKADTITLRGNVVLLRGEDVAKGERLTMQLAAGKTKLDGGSSQVNMVITPNESNGR